MRRANGEYVCILGRFAASCGIARLRHAADSVPNDRGTFRIENHWPSKTEAREHKPWWVHLRIKLPLGSPYYAKLNIKWVLVGQLHVNLLIKLPWEAPLHVNLRIK